MFMVDLEMPVPNEVPEQKTPRRKAAVKAEPDPKNEVRDWHAVVEQIRVLRNEGLTVPDIADKLDLDYVLVNQVMVQSYKMTVNTIDHFNTCEMRRLGIEA